MREALANALDRLGRRVISAVDALGYMGSLLVESVFFTAMGWTRGQPVRWRMVAEQARQIGVDAIPIVSLLSLTIGVMLGIQFIAALGEFGAQNQVVMAAGKAITREFGALITAIVVAGRTGSSLAARLGSMVVSQEIDALAVIGIEPVRYLVAPALIGLLLMMPVLTVFADAVALLGAGLYASGSLDIDIATYLLRTLQTLEPRDLWEGLSKSVVFALLIGLIGVSTGFAVQGGAEGVGRATTRAVVRSITAIVIADMLFSQSLNAAMSEQPLIEVTGLQAFYGKRRILHGVDFRVMPGEIRVIMGGSGSGKSTLLRHLLGLQAPAAGHIRVLGVDLAIATAAEKLRLRKLIGVSFQGGALFTSMSVGDNVALPLREHTRLDENTIRIMSRLKLEVVNLGGFQDLMPAQLSGGMVKRAALARAIVMDPKLLFFDEPSAGLDPVVSAELDELILQLRDALRMSIVVVTHELESAFKIADTITVLDHGHVLMTGTVEQVRASENERIQDLLNRRPREVEVNVDDYLRRLTEEEA